MGYMFHTRARTAPAVRREIQDSQESLKEKSLYDFIKAIWATEPERLTINPSTSLWD